MAYVSQGSSEDKLPRSLWGFTTWASKCSAWLSGNHLASFASEIHDSILTEALKQNAEGKCSEKRFEVFCSLVPKPGCFVPFHYCFSKRLAVNLGVTYKFGLPTVLDVFIQLLIQRRLIWGLLTPIRSIASFRGSVGPCVLSPVSIFAASTFAA